MLQMNQKEGVYKSDTSASKHDTAATWLKMIFQFIERGDREARIYRWNHHCTDDPDIQLNCWCLHLKHAKTFNTVDKKVTTWSKGMWKGIYGEKLKKLNLFGLQEENLDDLMIIHIFRSGHQTPQNCL